MAEKVPGWIERLLLPRLSSIEGELKGLKGELNGLRGEMGGDEAVIKVTDRGVGIPARDLERIFERFYRVDQGRRASGGTGLGLAIVRHVAANHRGSVQVESREGNGSTFTLRLPLQPRNEE